MVMAEETSYVATATNHGTPSTSASKNMVSPYLKKPQINQTTASSENIDDDHQSTPEDHHNKPTNYFTYKQHQAFLQQPGWTDPNNNIQQF